MAFTNAEKQARWRARRNARAEALQGDAPWIAEKIFDELGAKKTKRVVDLLRKRLKAIDPNCPVCKGTGITPLIEFKAPCGGKEGEFAVPCQCGEWAQQLMQETPKQAPSEKCGGTGQYQMQSFKCGAEKACETTPLFPCPDCRPAEYFVASGGQLRNQGRYAEAFDAAMNIMDYWAAGDTLIAWGVSPKAAQKAIRDKFGKNIFQSDIARLRDIAKGVPPGKRKHSWGVYREVGIDLPSI